MLDDIYNFNELYWMISNIMRGIMYVYVSMVYMYALHMR